MYACLKNTLGKGGSTVLEQMPSDRYKHARVSQKRVPTPCKHVPTPTLVIETVARELELGNFSLRTLAWELWLGNFSLGTSVGKL